MINVKNDTPTKEAFLDRLNFLMSEIRTVTMEVEQLTREATKSNYLITKEEACKILCCENIPKAIPKVKIGNKWRYELKDIEEFIEAKKFRR
jgi:hypothetical protein